MLPHFCRGIWAFLYSAHNYHIVNDTKYFIDAHPYNYVAWLVFSGASDDLLPADFCLLPPISFSLSLYVSQSLPLSVKMSVSGSNQNSKILFFAHFSPTLFQVSLSSISRLSHMLDVSSSSSYYLSAILANC